MMREGCRIGGARLGVIGRGWARWACVGVVMLALAGCATEPGAPGSAKARPRAATPQEQALALARRLLPSDVRDRDGWAQDIATSMVALKIPIQPHKVCAIAAIIEQESGWQADPVVQDLSSIARREMDRRLARYRIPGLVLDVVLSKRSPNGKTYAERLRQLRTERELSLLYEDFIREIPKGEALLSGMNPVRTGGSMQVSIAFAEEQMARESYPWRRHGSAREEVFTRRGGVYFGTAMLLDYPVSYNRMLYRFADYNAGRYASRNAAFQRLVAALSGRALAPDGDLLRYKDGRPAGTSQTQAAVEAIPGLGMSRGAIRDDLLAEKTHDFERTELYRRVRSLADRRGISTPNASVPDIALESPKITRKLTTRWFAERVEGRYRRCLARGT